VEQSKLNQSLEKFLSPNPNFFYRFEVHLSNTFSSPKGSQFRNGRGAFFGGLVKMVLRKRP
jgi:hypothetical protein